MLKDTLKKREAEADKKVAALETKLSESKDQAQFLKEQAAGHKVRVIQFLVLNHPGNIFVLNYFVSSAIYFKLYVYPLMQGGDGSANGEAKNGA